MPQFLEPFITPITDPQAQVAIIAMMALAFLDVVFGVANAWFVQHDFSSHEFRAGLLRKLSNMGMVIAADIVDAMLLGGLDLGVQPVLIMVTVSLALMELVSLLEIFAEMHPEILDTAWYQMLVHSKDSISKKDGE